MSARTELYEIARELRAYLEWQARTGAPGSTPATDEQRAVFEQLQKRREEQKLQAARRELMGEESPTPDTSSAQQPGEQPDRPRQRASAASESSESAGDDDNAAADFRKRLDEANEPDSAEAPDTDDSDDQPWKRLGSRPRPRFAAKKNEASTMSDDKKVRSNDAESGPSAGPQYDENAYPEASGVMMEGAVDAGGPVDDASGAGEGAGKQAKPQPSAEDMTKAEKLEFLEDYLGDCRRCGLCENRTNVVFGDGSAEARLVFVGEAPGYNEDKQGLPFVGDAGQLLDKMIEAMGLAREDVYICNVIKCRPPKNRNPHPDEIKECSPFLRKQLDVISPDVIVSLGKFASQWLLESDESMGRMRGRWQDWNGTAVMPTYHPAYLLRQESQKGKTWSDLQMVMERLGL